MVLAVIEVPTAITRHLLQLTYKVHLLVRKEPWHLLDHLSGQVSYLVEPPCSPNLPSSLLSVCPFLKQFLMSS